MATLEDLNTEPWIVEGRSRLGYLILPMLVAAVAIDSFLVRNTAKMGPNPKYLTRLLGLSAFAMVLVSQLIAVSMLYAHHR